MLRELSNRVEDPIIGSSLRLGCYAPITPADINLQQMACCSKKVEAPTRPQRKLTHYP